MMELPDSPAPQAPAALNVRHVAGCELVPGIRLTPLHLNGVAGLWIVFGRFAPGARLPTHYHTGAVHVLTTKGVWNAIEEEEAHAQTAGGYRFAPSASRCTFTVPEDATEDAEAFMIVTRGYANIVDGEPRHPADTGWLIDAFFTAARAVGAWPHDLRPGGRAP